MVTGCMLCSYILYSGGLCLLVPHTLALCSSPGDLVNFTGGFCWEKWFTVPRFWYLLCTRGVTASSRYIEMCFVRHSGEGVVGNMCPELMGKCCGSWRKGMQLGVGLFSLLRPLACFSWEDIFMRKTYIFCALCPDLLRCVVFGFSPDVLCILTENFNDLRLSVFPGTWLNLAHSNSTPVCGLNTWKPHRSKKTEI